MAMLSNNLEQSLHRALAQASAAGHEYAKLEHLLLALTEDPDAQVVLRACAVSVDLLQTALRHALDNDLGDLVSASLDVAKPTAGFQRVIQRAALHVQSSGRDDVTGANVLVALFSEHDSHAVYCLQQQDMSRLDAVNYISHGLAKGDEQKEAGEDAPSDDGEKSKKEALSSYCVNLNHKAVRGAIDPLIGRQKELDRTIQVLCRRTKNNPL